MYVASALSKVELPVFFSSDDGRFMLYQEDCVRAMSEMPPESVDLIFADPPYFLSNGGITCKSGRMASVHKGKWDVSLGINETHEFNRRWLSACRRILKPNGTVFISGTRHVIYSVGFALQQLGYKVLNDITWYKVTPPPNLSCRYFVHSTETILWAGRDARTKHHFAYQQMKEENGGKQMQSLWSILPPLKAEKRFGKHPTQKPLALLERIIKAASDEDALVLDPFSGSGTTGIACARLGRRYIGIEVETGFLDLSIRRFHDLDGESAASKTKDCKMRGQAKAH
ncbi:MAG: site-specific DNA-methyltransferase [Pseudomonadota bacterium]